LLFATGQSPGLINAVLRPPEWTPAARSSFRKLKVPKVIYGGGH
jgi:hypothetical protein